VLWIDSHNKEPISLDFAIGTSIVDIAVPSNLPSKQPAILQDSIIFAAACSDLTIKILLFPLSAPINDASDALGPSPSLLTELHLQEQPDLVSLTWTDGLTVGPKDNDMRMDRSAPGEGNIKEHGSSVSLLVATCSKDNPSFLSVARVTIETARDKMTTAQKTPFFQRTSLPSSPVSISFNPSARKHSEILVACESGTLYIFDPFASRTLNGFKNTTPPLKKDPPRGAWLASYTTRFASVPGDASSHLAHRKWLLDAQWSSSGSAIVALLQDGEWDVWDMQNGSCALWGRIDAGIPSHLSAQGASKSIDPSTSMTPSTRKLKAEALFSGNIASKNSVASVGGVSINATESTEEDSVTFWYNGTVCYIDSLKSYWARASKRSAETKLQTIGGSLFGPGLARVPIDSGELHGQTIINSVQLHSKQKRSIRAIAIVTEHQVLIRDNSRISAGATSNLLSHRHKAGPIHHHSRSLAHSMELDITSMDAILDSMEMSGALPAK
jgi:hypothetical protein